MRLEIYPHKNATSQEYWTPLATLAFGYSSFIPDLRSFAVECGQNVVTNYETEQTSERVHIGCQLGGVGAGLAVGDSSGDELLSDDQLDGVACGRCGVDFDPGDASMPGLVVDGCQLWLHPACVQNLF